MKYMLLIYEDEKIWDAMTPAESGAVMGEYRDFGRAITAAGHFVHGAQLAPSTTATSVRVQGGQVQSTDGPFAETREQLGGYYMIDAPNLDEAVAIAARIPAARTGAVEVRPIIEMPAPTSASAGEPRREAVTA